MGPPVIPATHVDLLDRPLNAVLTTHFPSGRLQASVVWFWRRGDEVLLSTMREFAKARNMHARPWATVLISDPDDGRWVEARADVTPVEDDARAALDALGVRYTGLSPYFGAVVPAHLAETEHPVTLRLTPHTVVTGSAPGPWPVAPTAAAPGDTRAAAPSTGSHATQTVPLPRSHDDLLQPGRVAALSTRAADGSARSRPVRCARVGEVVAFPARDETIRDLRSDPRATLLVVDPSDGGRWIEVRGDVDVGTSADDTVALLRPVRTICDAIH